MSSTKLDIEVLYPSQFGQAGTKKFIVATSATLIYPGEPVTRALGGIVVTPMATNKPVVATDYLEGIAISTSTNDASAAGEVWVQPILPGVIYRMRPHVTTAYDTQAEYNSLMGKRVLIDLIYGAYTLLASDGSTSGCVIEYLDVIKYPGWVAFSFRDGVRSLS